MGATTATDTFLAYTAGFFDADGSVGVYWIKSQGCQRGGYFRLMTQVCQKHWLPIFEEWQKCWGGSVFIGRKQWHWTLATRHAGLFLKDILPYLRNKRDQAQLAIKFQDAMKMKGGGLTDAEFEWQEAVSDALREMKRAGESAPVSLLKKVKAGVRQLRLWPTK